MIDFIKKWNVVNFMSSMFPYVGMSCLIWYYLDADINTMYAKIHLIIAFIFGSSRILQFLYEKD